MARSSWSKRRLLMMAAIAVGAVAVVAGFIAHSVGPEAHDAPWSHPQISPDGRAVTVQVLYGVCVGDAKVSPRLSVQESAVSVTLTVSIPPVHHAGDTCGDMAAGAILTAHLRQPLGTRSLVDGAV